MTVSTMRVLACSGVLFVTLAATAHAQAPPPPTGLSQQVTGNFVQVSWNASPGTVSYILQAGTASGASNLFNGAIGNINGASGTLPNGVYFWRVIAVGPSGEASAPSAESQFTVGESGGCVPPSAPQNLTQSVTGLSLTLRWSPPAGGGPPTGYIIEAGSGPGQSNLFVGPTAPAPTELTVQAPPGQYFVRLRAQNACGTSGVSNERTIVVGDGDPGTVGCSFSVSPSSANVPLSGGTIQVTVAAPGGCRWMLQSDAFITPTSNTGTGTTTVQYSVGATTATRTGQIVLTGLDPGTVTSAQVLVQQQQTSGGSCALSLNPTSQNVPPAGGQFEVRVTANPGCTWSAAPSAGFVSIVSQGLQSGTDSIRYSVAANTAAAARNASLRVSSSAGFQDLSITQQGLGALTASFVMRDSGQVSTSCQVSGANGNKCSLDASDSTPASQITAYNWTVLRNGAPLSVSPEKTPSLNLDCTQGAPVPGNSIEPFDVTLTVTGSGGQTATLRRMLSLHQAGCGQ